MDTKLLVAELKEQLRNRGRNVSQSVTRNAHAVRLPVSLEQMKSIRLRLENNVLGDWRNQPPARS